MNPPRRRAPLSKPIHAEALLETGFRHLYELNFTGAREHFLSYQKMKPGDPMGKAAEAASYLYEEFNAKGVFTSEFFLNDKKLLGGVDGKPSANRNDEFVDTNREARDMAKEWLKTRPNDPHGLLVLTITDGMESDYDGIIEKKQLAGLDLMRQAEREANTLLAIDPDAQDAYVALGASNYIIGCMPGFKRAFLWFGGVHGDRTKRHGRKCRWPPSTATISGRLRKFCWRWPASANIRWTAPANSSPNSPPSFPRIRSTPTKSNCSIIASPLAAS